MESKICLSCKKVVINDQGSVTFACPQCAKYTIVRCSACRKNANRYVCPSCHFSGPN